MSILKSIQLEYVSGSSDKIYVLQLIEDPVGSYKTVGYYGRRGSALSVATKYTGASRSHAEIAFAKVEKEKTGKGYTPFSGAVPGMPASASIPATTSPAATPAASKPKTPSLGYAVQLLDEIDANDIAARTEALHGYQAHREWGFQRKFDGVRVVVRLGSDGEVLMFNRTGIERPMPAALYAQLVYLTKTAWAKAIAEGTFELDGELCGDHLYAFDLPTLQGKSLRGQDYEARYLLLEELLDMTDRSQVHQVEMAWTQEQKAAMVTQALKEDWEGLVFKLLQADYTEGRSFGALKYKLWATATCEVIGHTDKESVELGMLDGAALVPVGKVTTPKGKPPIGALLEVRYLYAYVSTGGSLYQPTLIRERDDVSKADDICILRPPPPERRGTEPTEEESEVE